MCRYATRLIKPDNVIIAVKRCHSNSSLKRTLCKLRINFRNKRQVAPDHHSSLQRKPPGNAFGNMRRQASTSSSKPHDERSKQHTRSSTASTSHMLLSTTAIVEKATALLPALSKRDALTVWKGVGLYLQDQLCERRRMITVDGWGVFGMNAMGEAVFMHSAAFLQANRLRERLDTGLKGQPVLIASKPMPKLNAAEVGEEYLQNCRKETVTAVMAHVVAFIGRTAKQGNQVVISLTVAPLGEWRCDGEGRVEFRFTPEFQAQMLRSEGNDVKKRSIEEHEKEEDEKKSEKEETQQQLTRATLQEHTQQQRNVPLRAIPDHRPPSRARTANSASSRPTVSSHPSKTRRPTTAWTENSTAAESESIGSINSVRTKLLSRCGEQGLNALNRVLSLMDTSGDGVLSAQELKFGLRDLGIELSTRELRDVVAYFDRDGDGNVSLEELLDRLRGKLSTRRKVLIERAFYLMDRERKGFVTLADIKDNYDVSLLPRVRVGKMNKAQAMEEFLREWETSEGCDGHLRGVTRDAFRRYYHNISAGIREDSDFELLMRQTWHVTMSTPDEDCENEDTQDVFAMLSKKHHEIRPPSQHIQGVEPTKRPPATPAQSAQDQKDWTYLRAALLPARLNGAAPTIDDISRRLGANRVWGDGNDSMNTRAFANALCRLDRVLSSKDAVAIAQRVRDVCTETEPHQEGGDLIVLKILLQRLCSRSISSPSTSVAKNASSGTSPVTSIVDRIRHRLKERSMCSSGDVSDSPNTRPNPELAVLGLNALARTLRLMDANGDKRLTKDELKVGLRKCGVDVTFHELDQLFTVLDSDRSGCIDFDEFLVAMRGEMNARRLDFVHEAFALLDRDGDGVVTSQELAAAYDVSKHPEVLAGRLSAAEALNLFIQHWDNIDKDGNITRTEFKKYYQNVSASIDSDDYFELMMRNAWHISGGSGWCANTTNQRVLVTNTDGLQTVEEVQNDLGITAPEKIHAKLKAQGINVQKVETTGYVEHKNESYSKSKPAREHYGDTKSQSSNQSSARVQKSQQSRAETSSTRSRQDIRPRVENPPRQLKNKSKNASSSRSSLLSSRTDASERGSINANQARHQQRQKREWAALLIQSYFRGFKCRKFVDCVRRQQAAAALQRKREEEEDSAPGTRPRIHRTALRSFYGF